MATIDPAAAVASRIVGWIEPRLARDAQVLPDTVRLMGVVVHDRTFADPDTSARVSWIGDGSSPHQVMVAHAADLARYDVIVSVTWHDEGPEARVVLVNP